MSAIAGACGNLRDHQQSIHGILHGALDGAQASILWR